MGRARLESELGFGAVGVVVSWAFWHEGDVGWGVGCCEICGFIECGKLIRWDRFDFWNLAVLIIASWSA